MFSSYQKMLPSSVQIYLVGGAVRDKQLGLVVQECDYVVTGSTPEIMLNAGFKQVGKDFPVFLHPETHEEYALARTERKSGHGYYGFSCNADSNVSLKEDLVRRDLTINAMAIDQNGKLIDPFDGKQDMKNRVLRHVSSAFSEDPVRVLRVARFCAKLEVFGFTVHPDTQTFMRYMVKSGECHHLIAERVWQELMKALQYEHAYVFFKTLDSVGLVSTVFPTLSYSQMCINAKEAVDVHSYCSSNVSLYLAYLFSNVPFDGIRVIFQKLKASKQQTQWALLASRLRYFLAHYQRDPNVYLHHFERWDVLRKSDKFLTLCGLYGFIEPKWQGAIQHMIHVMNVLKNINYSRVKATPNKTIKQCIQDKRLWEIKDSF